MGDKGTGLHLYKNSGTSRYIINILFHLIYNSKPWQLTMFCVQPRLNGETC